MNKSTSAQIEKQIEIDASVSRVWEVLTNYREFGQWFRVHLTSPFVVGEVCRGQITYPGYEHLTMEMLIEAIEPEKRFAFRWHPYAIDPSVDYSAEKRTLVEFQLEPTPTGTLVQVVESGFEHIPDSRRDEAFHMNDGGWAEQVKNIQSYVQDKK